MLRHVREKALYILLAVLSIASSIFIAYSVKAHFPLSSTACDRKFGKFDLSSLCNLHTKTYNICDLSRTNPVSYCCRFLVFGLLLEDSFMDHT